MAEPVTAEYLAADLGVEILEAAVFDTARIGPTYGPIEWQEIEEARRG